MRTRGLAVAVIALVSVAWVVGAPRVAHADPKGDVQAKIKEGMESYDLLDYDAARKALNQAIAIAKKAKLDKDPLVARAYLDIGIVAFAVPDQEGAKVSFLSAVQIDPKIQIDPAYKSPEMAKLLEEARSEATGGGTGPGPGPDVGGGPDCSSVKGLEHQIVDTAKGGAPLALEAQLGPDVKATKVVIMFRPEGATDFTEVRMTATGCSYKGQIPASAMKGSLVHYYIAAYDGGNKPVAAKGSAGSPNIIEVTSGGGGGGGTVGDTEDPINGGKPIKPVSGGGGSGGGSISSGVVVPHGPPKIMFAVSGGTGFGYVTGTTEGGNTVKNCCLGSSLAVVVPEIGYHLNPRTSIGVAIRLGFPVGANIDGHATMAPGGMLRLRYALSPTGTGLHVMGQIGAGILRSTIKLDTSTNGMDTDIVAQGPLLVGGGVGYTKQLSGSIAFLVDFSALLGVAVTDHLGSAPALNTGLSADLSLGLAFGF
jgi:hypothetical protein